MNISFNKDKLYEIMAHFYTLTKIRIVVFDDELHKILSVPEYDCDFCRELKTDNELKLRCVQCDKKARESCLKTGKMHIYTCHAGMIEAIAPLRMNGVVLGYAMLGRIIDKSEKKKKKEDILNYIKEYVPKDLNNEYEKLTTKTKKQITAAANIMEACAYYLWANELVKVNEDCLSVLIAKYIDARLTSDLSVESLCEQFGISRNKLYKIAHESYGMSIAAYVKKERLKKAALLLESGATVAEAAVNSGFEDYNYFSTVFKRELGILPSKYAQSHSSNAVK